VAVLPGQSAFSKSLLSTAAAAPTTAATLIIAASSRRTLTLYNNGSVVVYIGGATVTSSTGFPIAAGVELAIDDPTTNAIYGITASGTGDIRYLAIT
jgi:hypothetical protein